LLVVGYSGDSDDLFSIIRDDFRDDEKIYWLTHGEVPASNIVDFMSGKEHVQHLGGCDADLSLIELARAIGCWPPAVFTDPEGHLLSELEPVVDLPSDAKYGIDILAQTRSRLKKASQNAIVENQPVNLVLEGRVDEAARKLKRAVGKARHSPASTRLRASLLFAQAYALQEKFEASTSERAAKRLFSAAAAKYSEAIKIKPDYFEALNNLGNLLSDQAKRTKDAKESVRLFDDATVKFAEAVKSKPDDHLVYFNWGMLLSERAERVTDAAEASRLYDDAGAKFAKATEIKPDSFEAFNNWGNLLAMQSERANDTKQSARLFDDAAAKFAEAERIKPDEVRILVSWGSLLLGHAKRVKDASIAARFFDEAKVKLLAAKQLAPGNTYALACLFALTGQASQCRENLLIAEKAGSLPSASFLRSDDDLVSVRSEPWFLELLSRQGE
jgi:Tfp pilus assembly protein PilF